MIPGQNFKYTIIKISERHVRIWSQKIRSRFLVFFFLKTRAGEKNNGNLPTRHPCFPFIEGFKGECARPTFLDSPETDNTQVECETIAGESYYDSDHKESTNLFYFYSFQI